MLLILLGKVVRNMRYVDVVAKILVIIGGLNWGLVGAFKFNLVEALLGKATFMTNLVYILVGIAAIYEIIYYFVKQD